MNEFVCRLTPHKSFFAHFQCLVDENNMMVIYLALFEEENLSLQKVFLDDRLWLVFVPSI